MGTRLAIWLAEETTEYFCFVLQDEMSQDNSPKHVLTFQRERDNARIVLFSQYAIHKHE